MVSDPYNDDDDQPTLQRPAPASGPAPKLPAPPPRFPSGVRERFVLDEAAVDTTSENPFPEEDDTAVDRVPLAPLAPLAPTDETVAALEETATALPDETATALADVEQDTVTLPVDIAAVLQRASAGSEPPPPSPLGGPPRRNDEA